MQDSAKKRETITLAWTARSDQGGAAPAPDDYVEVESVQASALVRQIQRRVREVDEPGESGFLRRMDNWRRTVYGIAGRGGGGCCAAWAALYVAARNKGRDVDEIPGPPQAIVSVDELDGWLVEAAVRSMFDFNEKQALRYWYVRRYPERWIKSKLLLRKHDVRLVLARAEAHLQKILDTLESPTKILTNTFHAGTDPRPESSDVPDGASLTLE